MLCTVCCALSYQCFSWPLLHCIACCAVLVLVLLRDVVVPCSAVCCDAFVAVLSCSAIFCLLHALAVPSPVSQDGEDVHDGRETRSFSKRLEYHHKSVGSSIPMPTLSVACVNFVHRR